MRTITPELSTLLQQMEQSLLLPEVRCNRQTLETILAEDFREITPAGLVRDRSSTIARVLSEHDGNTITMTDFCITILTIDHHGNNVAMTSYISTHSASSGKPVRRARRTSIWLHCNNTWRMRFHQATMLE